MIKKRTNEETMGRRKKLLIINCKTYGEHPALLMERIAKSAHEAQKNTPKKNVEIIIAVPATDVYRIASLGIIKVYGEHIDPVEPGAHTGDITAEDLKDNGATGVIINHSEDPYDYQALKKAVKRAKEEGLTTIVCAKDPETAKKIVKTNPDYIAVEPPELIGGEVSVSTAKPEIITESKEAIKNKPLIVGAGIKNSEDVKKAISLGAIGVLVASGVALAKDPEKAIKELLRGF